MRIFARIPALVLAMMLVAAMPARAEPLPAKVIATIENFKRFLIAVEFCPLKDAPAGFLASPLVRGSLKKAEERLVAQGYSQALTRAFLFINPNPPFDDTTRAEDVIAFCEGAGDWYARGYMKFDLDLTGDIAKVYPLPGGKDDAAVLDLVATVSAPWTTLMLCTRLKSPLRESWQKILASDTPAAIAELDRFDLSDLVRDDARAQLNAIIAGFPPSSVPSFGALKAMCDPAQNETMKFDFESLAGRPSHQLKQLKPAK
jgi:hypothetical protein